MANKTNYTSQLEEIQKIRKAQIQFLKDFVNDLEVEQDDPILVREFSKYKIITTYDDNSLSICRHGRLIFRSYYHNSEQKLLIYNIDSYNIISVENCNIETLDKICVELFTLLNNFNAQQHE